MTEEQTERQEEHEARDFGLSDEAVREILDALDAGQDQRLKSLIIDLEHADAADLLEHLSSEEREKVLIVLGKDFASEILAELGEVVRDEVVDILGVDVLAAAVEELESDDALYLVEDLEKEEQEELLKSLSSEDRAIIEQGLSFPEDSAGRMMQREVVAMPSFFTVRQAIDHLMGQPDEAPDHFYDLFVIDPRYHPIGRVTLSRLLCADRAVTLEDIMDADVHPIPATMDQEEVAFLFRQRNWITAMVVDEDGRLLGAVTVDDIVDVIDEEAADDMLGLAGVSEGDIYRAAMGTCRDRFSWLFLNLGAAFLVSSVVGLFEKTIEEIVALAILMPIVASMGGNAGHQTLAVAVRALAMKALTPTNALRIVGKEMVVGLMNGVMFAVITGAAALFWFKDPGLGYVIGLAMVINLLLAGFTGIVIPLTLNKFKIDPAVASGVFLTGITDTVGFFVFLGLAKLLLF